MNWVPPSLSDPQLEPADHAYTILQDHGPADGGWGPAALVVPWEPSMSPPRPLIYTGEAPHAIEVLKQLCVKLAADTGKPTALVRYTQREDVFFAGGS